MSNNNLLKIGWRNDDLLWVNINQEGKDSIREFVAAISGYKLSNKNGPINIERWLNKALPHYYDRRYNVSVPRFRSAPFWSFTNDFALVTNRLIMLNYCNTGGAAIIQCMQEAVDSASNRYARILLANGEPHVD